MKLPSGFQFSGITAGIKKSGKTDMAFVVTDRPALAAGVYTQNVIRAASIDWNRTITPTGQFRGLVVNSGNANACTGKQGLEDNRRMAAQLAEKIGANEKQICVLSTGVIGHLMPMPKIVEGINAGVSALGNQPGHFDQAVQGIMTTDSGPKTAHSTVSIGDQEIRISAMAKGAGMIGPNMATMLAVITTDAHLNESEIQPLLKRVTDKSFNNISVEGHTSTNDALLLIASGASSPGPLESADLEAFENELTRIAIELAKKIPADGEGATHLIEITVSGAESNADADRIARSIANSALVKTAILGGDPNWGRIVSAAGYCGVPLDPSLISLRLNGFELFNGGTPVPFSAVEVSQSIKGQFDTFVDLRVGNGSGCTRHWTSDLTIDYVKFNSEYTT